MPGPHASHAGYAHGRGWNWDEPPPEWRLPSWFTLWAPVVVAFLIQVPAAFVVVRLSGTTGSLAAASIGLAVLGPLALLFARRFPGPVVAVTALAGSVDLFLDHPGPPYIALAFAIIGSIARGARIWAFIAVSVCWVGSVSLAIALGRDWSPIKIAGTTLGILLVMGVGESLRTRRERFAEVRRLALERRQSEVQAERVRIARELHDVLAHSLSQINVQAGVGLHLMDKQPEKAKEALASIKESSKTALDEVRSVLGMLRSEGGADPAAPLLPEPDLSRLPGLAASLGTLGVEVRLDNALGPEVPAPVQLALYRIVQESLTNVGRHAHARTASVSLTRDGADYRVEVHDDGTGPTGPASESGGRGLLGMRERAELLGGHLSAGPAEGGGFRVLATIPADVRERQEAP